MPLLNTKISLNGAYASLIDANSDTYAPEHQFSEVDDTCAAAATSLSIDTELKTKLDALKTMVLKPDDYMRWKLRSSVWEDAMFKLNQIETDLHKTVKVQFIGEPAVHQGGPSREFFSLLNAAKKQKILSHGVFRYDVSLLQQKQYFSFGQLTALGLLQGYPGPNCFQRSVLDYILYRDIGIIKPTIDEIPVLEVKEALALLVDIQAIHHFF